MDDKTEELRDIFMDVSDEETVTERQEETPGSITGAGPGADDVETVVGELRDSQGFEVDLDDATLAAVVEAFYDGADDDAIAETVGVDPATAFRARMELHLLADGDLDPEFDADGDGDVDADVAADSDIDADAAADRLAEGTEPDDVAAALDADPAAVRRYARAREARRASLRANHRFRDRFEEALGEVDLSRRLAAEVREDGLEDATEGMETDVSF